MSSSSSQLYFPVSQYFGLETFYNSLSGSNWNWVNGENGKWNFTTTTTNNNTIIYNNPCVDQWQGVQCAPSCFVPVSGDSVNNCSITSLNLTSFSMLGQLPDIFGNFTQLERIYFNKNLISGQLPSSLFVLSNLLVMNLADNKLSTSIAFTQLIQLESLQSISLANNYIFGSVPFATNGDTRVLKNLFNVDLDQNYLTGNIPSSICLFTTLRALDISSNYVTGVIPSQVSSLQYLEQLDFSSNNMGGVLPTSLTSLKHLQVLLLQDNFFTGTVDVIAPIHSVVTLDLSENSFTGSIPPSLFNSSNVESVTLVNNCFSGHISQSICNATNLIALDLRGLSAGSSCTTNYLSSYTNAFIKGKIPSCIFEMKHLQSLHLSGNGFHGSLPDHVLLSSSLKHVTLSYNRLDGSLPSAFQEFPFESFDISYNKISGTCEQLSMNLDGLSTTRHNSDVPHNFSTKLNMQVNRLSGNLAPSFYSAPNLTVVNGNLFYCSHQTDLPPNDPGTINAVCGTEVTNVSFYGTLFLMLAGFLLFIWYSLNGCFNLNPVGRTKSIAITKVNKNDDGDSLGIERSLLPPGDMDGSGDGVLLRRMTTVIENLIDVDDMPEASLNLDVFQVSDLYAVHNTNEVENSGNSQHQQSWLEGFSRSLFFETSNSPTLKHLQAHLLTKSLFQWIKITSHVMQNKPEDLIETTRFLRAIVEIRNTFWIITFFILLVVLPVYLGLRFTAVTTYNTHRYQYAFAPSLAYFSGNAPAIALFVLLVVCSIVILWIMTKIQRQDKSKRTASKQKQQKRRSLLKSSRFLSARYNPHLNSEYSFPLSQSQQETSSTSSNLESEKEIQIKKNRIQQSANITLYFIIPAVNLIVILAANIFYIYIIFTQKRAWKLIATTVISTFKMIWNMLVMPALMQSVKGFGPMFMRKMVMQMIIMIFNVVLAPVLVNAVASPDCLFHLFFPADNTFSTTTYNVCSNYNAAGNCTSYDVEVFQTEFHPPFLYGFQCGSSALLNYVPAFVQMYAMIMGIMPLVAIIMFSLMELQTEDIDVSSLPFFKKWMTRLAIYLKNLPTIPPIYKNATLLGNYELGVVSPKDYEKSNNDDGESSPKSPTFVISPLQKKTMLETYHSKEKRTVDAPKQTILNPDTIFSHLMGHMMMLVTFGIAYPPLALLITLTVSIVSFQWQILVGRYLSQIATREPTELAFLKIQIEIGCYGISRRFFRKTKWFIIAMIGAFYILYAYDMTADQVYDENTNAWIWAILIFALFPVAMFISFQMYQRRKVLLKNCCHCLSKPWLMMKGIGRSTTYQSTASASSDARALWTENFTRVFNHFTLSENGSQSHLRRDDSNNDSFDSR